MSAYLVECNPQPLAGTMETEFTARAWIACGERKSKREAERLAVECVERRGMARARVFKTGATLGLMVFAISRPPLPEGEVKP